MKSQTILMCGLISLSGLNAAPLWAQAEPSRAAIKASEEVQLQKLTPTVKSFTIKLEGSVREQDALTEIEKIIRDIFSNSRIGTAAVPVQGEPVPSKQVQVYENLQIIVNAKKMDEAEQEQYRIHLHLHEKADKASEFSESEPKVATKILTYRPTATKAFKQDLQAFLSKELNFLQPKAKSSVTTPSAESTEEKTSSAAAEAVTKNASTAAAAASSKAVDAPPPSMARAINPPLTETVEAGVPKNVNPKEEIQLQNLTPTVKGFSVKLEGSEREASALNDIERMIRKIFNESRIGTTVIPVSGEPVAPSDIPVSGESVAPSEVKTYENLEIVVNAKTGEDTGQPYRVNITLRESGMDGGTAKTFSYAPAYSDVFYDALKSYLTKHLNLRPKTR